MIISWKGSIDSAHFIPGHPKCGRLHGHTYHIEIEIDDNLPYYNTGQKHPHYVLDYGEIKKVVMELDHRLLIPTEHNEITVDEFKKPPRLVIQWFEEEQQNSIVLRSNDVCLLPITETSAEILAEYLGQRIQSYWAEDTLSATIRVTVRETPNTSATAWT